jgi:hypothetical protein
MSLDQIHHPAGGYVTRKSLISKSLTSSSLISRSWISRSWISMIGTFVLLALAAALAFAMIVAGASVALASHQNPELVAQASPPVVPGPSEEITGSSFSGVITDSRCGARHVRNSDASPAQCARKCVRNGSKYVLIDGNRRYDLTGDNGIIDKFAGERVTVTGVLQGGTIAVTSAVQFSAP